MRSIRLEVVVVCAVIALPGCSSEETSTPGGVPDAGGGGTVTEELLAAPEPSEGFQIAMDARIEAGQEVTYCQLKALPPGEYDLQKFVSRYSPGSHHLLVFATGQAASEVDLNAPPTVCGEDGEALMGDPGSGFGLVYGAQDPNSGLEYPPGVAKHVVGDTVVLVQAHYLNSSDQPVDAAIRLNAYYATAPVTAYADSLFYFNYAIYLPPNGAGKAHMRCVVPQDITLLGAAAHAHRRLTYYRAELSGGDLAAPKMLYETDEWENTDPAVFVPFQEIKAGQMIDFECEFQNDRDEVTLVGASADTNEMCMFIGAYYPQMDLASSACLVENSGPIGSGTKTCGETLQCMSTAATGGLEALQKCFNEVCEKSSIPLDNIYTCGVQKCGGSVADMASGSMDLGCFLSECAPQLAVCQESTCD